MNRADALARLQRWWTAPPMCRACGGDETHARLEAAAARRQGGACAGEGRRARCTESSSASRPPQWRMARPSTLRECGGSSAKWLGKCPHCDAWNTLDETVAEPAGRRRTASSRSPRAAVATLSEIDAAEVARTPTGQEELDRVLGGGIVEGAWC